LCSLVIILSYNNIGRRSLLFIKNSISFSYISACLISPYKLFSSSS
jgi:hypothetical protein